ncbi:MAG TPA: dephospho-CoA kinase [Bacillota bacterium]|nr:dephospho-CoA kinase [Bacillota bacterium]HUM56041.1 dephospho-CoA kinase [Bacillota bacterium]
MKKVGLTGGIGSGKSTVSAYIEKKGIPVIDADKIAREIVKKGSPVLTELSEAFGDDIIDEKGQLDRKKLASRAFSDIESKNILDRITQERIYDIIYSRLKNISLEGKGKMVLIDAPLLFESGLSDLADEIWVVSADLKTRVERVAERDMISREQISRIAQNQLDEEEKEKKADHVLDNSGTKEQLYEQIERLLKKI